MDSPYILWLKRLFQRAKQLLRDKQTAQSEDSVIAPSTLNTEVDEPLFAEQRVDLANIAAFRAENFPVSGPFPWLDRPDAEAQIVNKLASEQMTPEEAEQCRGWIQHGYLILPSLIEADLLDEVWSAYAAAVADGTIVLKPQKISDRDPYPGRFLNPHLQVPQICYLMRHPSLLRWLKVLMDREPAPFQTITSHKGSQQLAHSDSIHMTTYPIGYLTAAWIALEDIHPDSGPLIYYPGSHRLPYVFSKDVGIAAEDFHQQGYQSYSKRYEPYIQQLMDKHEIEPHYFHAKKGDVLIWHANLVHGGSLRRNHVLSRKALVCHYFVKGALAYHDLAASRTVPYAGTCLL